MVSPQATLRRLRSSESRRRFRGELECFAKIIHRSLQMIGLFLEFAEHKMV
jgi:hypothetical protein